MTRPVADGGELTATVKYSIEDGWDYAFLEASDDGGATWEAVETSESYVGPDDSGFNPSGFGISGTSDGWVDLTATVPDGTDAIRWRYLTDGAFALNGFQVDNITLDGEVIGDAETPDEGWTFKGFRRTTGTDFVSYLNAYFVDNRQYVRRDNLLRHLYSFIGYSGKRSNKVEFYRERAWRAGHLLGHDVLRQQRGRPPRSRRAVGRRRAPGVRSLPQPGPAVGEPRQAGLRLDLRVEAEPRRQRALPDPALHDRGPGHASVFNDLRDWWFMNDEHTVEGVHPGHNQPGWSSVNVPDFGVKIKVVKVADNGDMTIAVSPAG